MPGRNFSSEKYRYGFNGKEKDKDMNSLTAYDYGFRIYNPAIGKFLSVDPLIGSFAYLTPYQFSCNNPIVFIDLDGKEAALSQFEQSIYIAPTLKLTNLDPTFIPGANQAYKQPNVFLIQESTKAQISSKLLEMKTNGYKIKGLIIDSHGEHGKSIQIGETKYSLDPEEIKNGAVKPADDPFLKELGQYIGGDIILLGCQVGINENLMTEIAKTTGKTIIASEGWNANWPGMFNDPGYLNDPEFNSIVKQIVKENFDYFFNKASEAEQMYMHMLSGYAPTYSEGQALIEAVLVGGVKSEIMAMMAEGISPSGAPPIYDDYDTRNKEAKVVHSRVGRWKKANPDGSVESRPNTLVLTPEGAWRTTDKPFYNTRQGKFYDELYQQRFPGSPAPSQVQTQVGEH